MQSMRYWGKAKPSRESLAEWHLLPFHSLDVAAVAGLYLRGHPRLLELFASRLGLSIDTTLDWLCYLLALHDLDRRACMTEVVNLLP